MPENSVHHAVLLFIKYNHEKGGEEFLFLKIKNGGSSIFPYSLFRTVLQPGATPFNFYKMILETMKCALPVRQSSTFTYEGAICQTVCFIDTSLDAALEATLNSLHRDCTWLSRSQYVKLSMQQWSALDLSVLENYSSIKRE